MFNDAQKTPRQSASRLRIVAAAVTLAVGLAGCESSNILSNNAQPQTALAPQPATPPQPAPIKIAFAQVIGAPDQAQRQIQQDMTTAATAQRISLVAANEPTDLTLRGYFVAGKDKQGTKFSYIWDVTDKQGNRVHRVVADEFGATLPANQRDHWVALTPQLSQTIAQKSIASIAPVIEPRRTNAAGPAIAAQPGAPASPTVVPTAPIATAANTPPATAPAAPAPRVQPAAVGSAARQPASAFVASISGAPGDGSAALSTAMRNELTRGGLPAPQSGVGGYRVEAVVKLGPANDAGNQPIQIDWHVKDQAGARVGTVSQKNEIPQGSLDGQWGEAANAAAAAAAQGVMKLVREHSLRLASN